MIEAKKLAAAYGAELKRVPLSSGRYTLFTNRCERFTITREQLPADSSREPRWFVTDANGKPLAAGELWGVTLADAVREAFQTVGILAAC